MSLINEMLHDLDSTRTKQDKTLAADPLLSDSGLLNSNSSSTWIPGVIAFVVVASLLLLQQLNDDEVAEPSVTPLTEHNPTAVEKNHNNSPDSASEKTLLAPNYYPKLINSMAPAQADSAPIPAGVESIEQSKEQQAIRAAVALEKKISELLSAASKAFTLDRLLSPAEDNACDRYREILLLQPNHPQAIAGLESAANRYINLALDYAAQGNALRAKVLLRRAEAVMPESVLVRNNIEQARQRVMSAKAQEGVQLAPLQKDSHSAQSSVQKSLDSTPVESSPSQNFVRSSSNEWRDLNAARKAKRLLSKGRTDEALAGLKQFINGAPESQHSLDLLLHTLIDQGEVSEAQRYLLAAQHLESSDVIEYNAHILVAENNTSEAILLLESQFENARDDYSYQVLLAGLYHREGNYMSSVEAYSRLLKEHGKKSEYWLGLAVSLDSLNRDDDALQAFISAKDTTQNEQVQRYIAARIQALRNKANANSKLQPQASNVPS